MFVPSFPPHIEASASSGFRAFVDWWRGDCPATVWSGSAKRIKRRMFMAFLLGLTAAIFTFDTVSPEAVTVAVLYVVVILASSSLTDRRGVITTALACAALTVVSFLIDHEGHVWSDALVRCLVSLSANLITTALALRTLGVTAALAGAKDAAEAANRAKSAFLANMSHEIRTPLNGVLGLTVALSQTELTAAQRELVDMVIGSGRTLEELLNDILDLARVEAGRLTVRSEPFGLRNAVDNAVALARVKGAEKSLAVTLEVDDDVPERVHGDETRLKQILGNLLGNAVKFTHRGVVDLTVRVVGAEASRKLVFEVRDTGIGIAPEVLPRLFQRFTQADGTITREFGGSGLGLVISRDLAVLMDGDLEVASALGIGSCFRLTLPLIEAGPEAAQLVEPCATPPADPSMLRILLAEDNATNAKVVSLILGAVDITPTWVENGQMALDRAAKETFDLVLMDLQMPVMDGLTAIRALRRRDGAATPRDVPIVVLSANAMPEDVAKAMAAGAQAHLGKPLSAASLLGALNLAFGACETAA